MSSSLRPRPQHGYALVIMLVMLVTGSLYAIVSRLDANRMKTAQVTETARSLQLARDALLAYASTYRDRNPDALPGSASFAYLPCPDTASDDGAPFNMIGTEAGNCGSTGVYAIGLLPHKTLGLPELRDSEGNCLWYAVSGIHKNNPKSEELNWDTRGQLEVLDVGGGKLIALDGEEGGAVAIVIAPGAPLATAAGHQSDARMPIVDKSCGTDASQMAAYLEALDTQFINGTRKAVDGSITSNDQLAWLTARDIFTQVKKRSDFASYINTHIAALRKKLASSMPASGSGNALPASNLFDDDLEKSAYNFYASWYDQIQYYKCSASPYCFRSANGTKCDGVLLMSGSGIRSSTEWTANVLAQEAKGISFSGTERATPPGEPRAPLRHSALDRYEDVLPFVTNTSNPFVANPLYANATPTRDLGTCLRFLIEGFDNFQTTQSRVSDPSQAVVKTSTDPSFLQTGLQRLILGSMSRIAAYGCSWHPDSIALDSGVRIYFRFNIAERGAGFTFALADASTNPSVQMCGATGNALGYSGNNGETTSIQPPKLAIEFDTSRSILLNDPNANHAAFVYWAGDSRDDNIDNKHAACATDVSPNTPCNPNTTSSGFRSLSALGDTNRNLFVRLEITPVTGASPAAYTLTAYIATSESVKTDCNLDNLDLAVDGGCSAAQLNSTLQTDMTRAFIGFTVGQRANFTGNQTITIDNFKAKGN